MFSLILQPVSALSQQEFNYGHSLHMHSHVDSHISLMNLWAHATKATLQLVKMHTISVTLYSWTSI